MSTRHWMTLAMLATALGCGSSGRGAGYGDYDSWASASASGSSSETATSGWGGSSGGLWGDRDATVNWSVEIQGVATDLMRTSEQNLVVARQGGTTTVWQVQGQGAEAIWSSDLLGEDAKLVADSEGNVRVVSRVTEGIAFASIDGSAEPTFVAVPAESPKLVGAVAGSEGDLWVAMEISPWDPGQVLRIAADGVVLEVHPLRQFDELVGILRLADKTVAYGSGDNGESWEKCLPDDGNPALAVTQGFFRVTGAWVDGGQPMMGFDIGGAGCVQEIDCETDDDEMEEVPMPAPTQAVGLYSYGLAGSKLVVATVDEWDVGVYTHSIAGAEFVAMKGDANGKAVAVANDGEVARVVQFSP